MSCSQFEYHLLYEYARGALGGDEAARVAEHLAVCDECRRTVDGLDGLGRNLRRLDEATQHDLPEGTAHRLLLQAAQQLDQQGGRRRLQWSAARHRPKVALRRLLMPIAAAVMVLLGLRVIGPMIEPPQYRALDYLYADAKNVATVTGIHDLQPRALSALDEAIASPTPDALRVANLQLIHYITLRAAEPDQIQDVHFLLKLLKDEDRLHPAALAAEAPQTVASLWQTSAVAAPTGSTAEEAADLVRHGRYDEAYGLLAGNDKPEVQALAAYAALRSLRLQEAHEAIETLKSLGGPERAIAPLLEAELAMMENRFDKATDYFAAAANEIDNRLWFQAGYLCKYEVGDDSLAGQYFERTADPEVVTHVTVRFHEDVVVARQEMALMQEDYEAYAAGPLPAAWKLVPTHPDEFMIAEIDGSLALKQNELGHRGGKLVTGFPGWHDYVMSCDFRVLQAELDPQLDFVVYDLGKSHYAVEFSDRAARLQIKTRQGPEAIVLRPENAQFRLPAALRDGDWWRLSVQVSNVDDNTTRVTATVARRDRPDEPAQSFTWIDQAGADLSPQRRGRVGFRVGGAEVAFDNLVVHADEGQ